MISISRKSKSYILPIIAIGSSLLIAAIGLYLLTRPSVYAADMRQFNPGNIMTDAVMANKDSMNVQQIQAFLNSRNACNNTNIHMAAWYPHLQYTIRDGRFICMAQDSFEGQSAAQIIWQVSQEFNINPQVLIVLLEKEQGLISDTWPNHIQYRSATGYGCPDTAPCDTQYYGLRNQLRHAASLFRNVLNGGWSNYPVGHTFVRYSPNAACGGSVINIQNRATSALYRYTPYQPNQAALNAGYGQGDSCSAYGNRNFWGLFTDWFGNTQGGYEIRGSIRVKYDAINGPSVLGNPVQPEKTDGNGFWWQQFKNGYIVGSAQTGYYISKGSIREKWSQLGFQNGQLGWPTSDELYDHVNKMYTQKYQGGVIKTHSAGANRHAIKGSIYTAYVKFNGQYNVPLEDENGDGRGFWWQRYKNGYIFGSAQTGYYESAGSIRKKWAESGYQNSPVGTPVGNIEQTSPGCYSQEYTKGRISGCNGNYAISLNVPND